MAIQDFNWTAWVDAAYFFLKILLYKYLELVGVDDTSWIETRGYFSISTPSNSLGTSGNQSTRERTRVQHRPPAIIISQSQKHNLLPSVHTSSHGHCHGLVSAKSSQTRTKCLRCRRKPFRLSCNRPPRPFHPSAACLPR